MTTVSVLIPTFNGIAFIEACLQAVVTQSYRDLEILVVDDGSTDSTVGVASKFAHRDSRVRVFANEANLGLVANWARCIELARGEWIKFAFQDDLLEPLCIETLLEEAERSGCPFVFCRRRYHFADGTPGSVRQFYVDHARLTEERFPARGWVPPETLAQMVLAAPTLESNFIGEPIAVLFKKSLIRQFGGFNPLLSVSCDSEFWQRIGVNVGVAHVWAELATFRVHERATTSAHLRDKAFRMNVLDPVVVLHEQVFHPAFGPLRRIAQQEGKNLEAIFREKAIWAFNTARHRATAKGGGSPAALADWRHVAARLPRLNQIEAEALKTQGYAARAMTKVRRLLLGS